MAIEPYKQSLTHSCLVACFLMLLKEAKGIIFSATTEQNICLKGCQRSYPFYVVGVSIEVAKFFNVRIQVIADNTYFAGVLRKNFNKELFDVDHDKITIPLIRRLLNKGPLICHIDDHFLGDFSHVSHFIVLEKCTEKTIVVIDPYAGKQRFMKDIQLESAIHSLKKHIKMCPLLFRIID